MLAFKNTEVTKGALLASLKAHATADRIAKGAYWSYGKGCAVGCSIHDFRPDYEFEHDLFEPLFGIPAELAHLEDAIFEGLPNGNAAKWPLRFSRAIRVGADLSLVWPRFAVWLLVDTQDGVLRFADSGKTRDAIIAVADLHRRQIAGNAPVQKEWDAAGDAARAAAWAAAWAAARDAAGDAARAAAWAAAWAAARDAARDAAWAAAWAAARAAAFKRQADKLIELLKAAP